MVFYYLPKEYQRIHEMCFELVEQVESFLTRDEYRFLQVTSVPLEKQEIEVIQNGLDIWDFLQKYYPERFRVQLNKSIILGLLRDFCYFMQESLDCSNKMRLVISYALLRRPLVDNLKVLLRLMFDEDFYDNFINRDDYDPVFLAESTLQQYLNETDRIRTTKTITGAFIYDCIFKKEDTGSIINLSNRAIHPVTTRPWNKTGEMNFNFMFTTHSDNERLWKHYYTYLSPILLFYVDLFNILIFSLFESEIDMELFPKRVNAIVDIMQKGFSK